MAIGDVRPLESDYLRTPGPGKVQLPDGRYVSENSLLGKQFLDEQRIRAEQEQQKQTIAELMRVADPFASQRAGYQQQLSNLMADPSAAIAKNPFLKASSEQGMEAANRKLNQMGMGASGNAALELQKASQANLSNDFFKLSDLLGGFSGANQNPAAGSQVALSGMGLYEGARKDATPERMYNGMDFTAKSSPLTLSRLSSYWGG